MASGKDADDRDDKEDVSTIGYIKQVIKGCFLRCLGSVLMSSPPELCEEVEALLKALRVKPMHVVQLYSTFHSLRQWEVDEALREGEEVESEIVTLATVIDVATVHELITSRRKYVQHLLDTLLKLGEVEDEVEWDHFLYILLKFCSLNRVELSQCLFQIILVEVKSDTYHFVTYQELQEFFWVYRECPVKAFNTAQIDFEKLPLSRYYVSDFCELLQRFTRLLNPLLHLQQCLQAFLPHSEFWDNLDLSHAFCRKITNEFFTMSPPRVHLRGEPPFRETCDMLAPDALGPEAVNQDQWINRTACIRLGHPLAQISVWGEQLNPELSERLEAEQLRQKLLAEAQADRKSVV